MFSRRTAFVWVCILLVAGMFLMGQEGWAPCNDMDGDGYGFPGSLRCEHREDDCADDDPGVHPGSVETCDNGVDDDCDGRIDVEDPYCDPGEFEFEECLGNTASYSASRLSLAVDPKTGLPPGEEISRPYVPGEALVKFVAGVSRNDAETMVARVGAEVVSDPSGPQDAWNRWLKVRLPKDSTVESAMAVLASMEQVESVQPNYVYILSATPNDTYYGQQWGLPYIDLPAVWDTRTDCRSVIVAVVDTGVQYGHPDLSGNMWDGQGCPTGYDGCPNHGYDFVGTNDNDPNDEHGHGTHVAGIIGAYGNNHAGTSGVCWRATIMAVRVLDKDGSGSSYDIAEGMDFARQAGAKIVNMSLGGDGPDLNMFDAAERLRNAGAIVVAAAGNGDASHNPIDTDVDFFHPGCFDLDNMINVTAISSNENLASYANYGAVSVDVAAPGTSIWSTYTGGSYKAMSGTSMATPHVSGLAALLWSQFPDATPRQIILAVFGGTAPLAGLAGKTCTGGAVNAAGSLDLLETWNPGN